MRHVSKKLFQQKKEKDEQVRSFAGTVTITLRAEGCDKCRLLSLSYKKKDTKPSPRAPGRQRVPEGVRHLGALLTL